MRRELGIARCGLACCLCSKHEKCGGCQDGDCQDQDWRKNRKCSINKGIEGCYQCDENCKEGLLAKIKPRGFVEFAKRYGIEKLLDCLEENEKNDVVYHRQGIVGDYDAFDNVEDLILFILNGRQATNGSQKGDSHL